MRKFILFFLKKCLGEKLYLKIRTDIMCFLGKHTNSLKIQRKWSENYLKSDDKENFSKEIGEDFVQFLGYNPLLNSIDIYFNASYINKSFLDKLL